MLQIDLWKRVLIWLVCVTGLLLALPNAFYTRVEMANDAAIEIVAKGETPAWVLLLLSVIATLISFLIGNKGISTQLKYAEQYYIEAKANAFNKFNIYAYLNSSLNYISGTLFLVALSCVVSFVILNIN